MILLRQSSKRVSRAIFINQFWLVGIKFSEQVKYDKESCQQFNKMLTSKSDSQSIDLNCDVVNRWFLGCLFSRIIGSNLPLSIYISQSVNYHKEVQMGQEVHGQVQVIKDLGRNKYELNTVCVNKDGELVMSGKAIILQE